MKNKKIKVLIPNATSPKNIGDLAMLTTLLSFFPKSKYQVTVHTVDPELYHDNKAEYKQTIYDWAVLSVTSPIKRCFRMFELVYNLIFFPKNYSNVELNNLLFDYKNADLVAFVGGGYIRAGKGVLQTLNLIMQLLPFYISQKVSKKTVVCPISFGPFYNDFQAKLSAYILKYVQNIAVREDISKQVLNKYGIKNVFVSSDHALLLPVYTKKHTTRGVIGFTIRDWGTESEKIRLENAVITSLAEIAKVFKVKVKPIIQVSAPEYNEGDTYRTMRVANKLREKNVYVLPPKTNKSLSDALKTYRSIDLLLGMRMHSAILAAIQGTPYVAIGYEHKSFGITRQLKMDKYCVEYSEANPGTLFSLLSSLYKNRFKAGLILSKEVKKIQKNELPRWNGYLGNL